MRPTPIHEAAILIALQTNTPYGKGLRKEQGQMMVEKVCEVQVRKELQSMAWFNEMKSKSMGHSLKARELFRAKKYSFAQLPFRVQRGYLDG